MSINSIQAFADIVDDFADIMHNADETVKRGVRYKSNLLWIHAFAALIIAPLFALTSKAAMVAPSFYFIRQVPGVPYSIATLIGFGGFLLGIGIVFSWRRLMTAGLVALGLWYVLFAFSLAVPGVIWLLDKSVAQPPFYAPIVYLHLAIIMVVHIWSLIHKTRR